MINLSQEHFSLEDQITLSELSMVETDRNGMPLFFLTSFPPPFVAFSFPSLSLLSHLLLFFTTPLQRWNLSIGEFVSAKSPINEDEDYGESAPDRKSVV